MSFQETVPIELKTLLTSRPNFPNANKKNPLKKRVFINAIQLVLDAYFIANGNLIIKANNAIIFNSQDKDLLLSRNIPLTFQDLPLDQGRQIKFFFWNKNIELVEIKGLAYITLSEDPKLSINTIQMANINDLLQEISKPEILFELKGYTISEQTTLIDMMGYTKLIVNIAATPPTTTIVFSDYANSDLIVDGDLNTKTPDLFMGSSAPIIVQETRVDFQTKAVRNLSTKFESHSDNPGRPAPFFGITRVKISISDTDSGYVEIHTSDHLYIGGAVHVDNIDAGSHDFRFAKVTLEEFDNGSDDHRFSNDTAMYEIFDSALSGGTASLSFEELDINSNIFSTLIPASEFGTVTSGNSVKSQVGDANNVSITGKTYFLPSTQTGFRAKLAITIGGITTGVSIRKIQ